MQTLDSLFGRLRPKVLSPRKGFAAIRQGRNERSQLLTSPGGAQDASESPQRTHPSAALHTGLSSHAAAITLQPLPIEVSASVAPLGPGRVAGLSQWAISLGKPEAPAQYAAAARAPLGASPTSDGPADPVTESEKKRADRHLMGILTMVANSDSVMPWVRNMEIGHGVVYSGFIDDEGFPDLFGCIKYFGASQSTVDGPGGAYRVHVITQHGVSQPSGWNSRQLDKTAKHVVRPTFSLPSMVAHIVHRASPATSGMTAQAVYLGELHKGRRHGLGRIKYLAGAEYAGTWEHDQMQGVGVMRQADGSRYYGSIMRKLYHGHGLLIARDPTVDQGFRTTEGLFTDGHCDICAIVGHMPLKNFHIKRNSFVTLNLDSILATRLVDPELDMALAGEVEEAFSKALDADLGANFLVNLVLQLDDMVMTSDGEDVAGSAYTNNACVRDYKDSARLRAAWIEMMAKNEHIPLLHEALLNIARSATARDHEFPSCVYAERARADMTNNVRMEMHLCETYNSIAATYPLLLAFQRQVCRDVSAATRVPLDRFHIVSVRAGEGHSHSVIVQLLIIADIMGPTPNAIADRLLSHVHKMESELLKGIYTRNITKCIRHGESGDSATMHGCDSVIAWEHQNNMALDVLSARYRKAWGAPPRSEAEMDARCGRTSAQRLRSSKYELRPRSIFGIAISRATSCEINRLPSVTRSSSSKQSKTPLESPERTKQVVEAPRPPKPAEGEPSRIAAGKSSWMDRAMNRETRSDELPKPNVQGDADTGLLLQTLMEKRHALKRLLEAGKFSDGIRPAVARSAPQSPERTEQAQEQIQKKIDGSKFKDATGEREWGAAWLVPEDGWHGARVDSRSAVTAALASRAREESTRVVSPSTALKTLQEGEQREEAQRGAPGSAKHVSSAMSIGSTSSRRHHQATPGALDNNGAVRAIYVTDISASRKQVEDHLDVELKAQASRSPAALSPSFSDLSAVEKAEESPPLRAGGFVGGLFGGRVYLPLPDQGAQI